MPVKKERWDVDLWLFKECLFSFLTEVFGFLSHSIQTPAEEQKYILWKLALG